MNIALNGWEEMEALKVARQYLEDRFFEALTDDDVDFLEYENDESGNWSYVKDQFAFASVEEMQGYLEGRNA